MRRPDGYQTALITAALLVVFLSSIFIYRELRPEYKQYQEGYIAIEKAAGKPKPPFKKGVKQILVQDSDVGPESVDRCTSCHVTMKLPHFSPTQPAHDINGNLLFDENGNVILEENPDYIFNSVGEEFDHLKGVLIAHPLLEGETRPFEFHSMQEYGCTSCHGGNGRSLVTERAHGPVFDGEYEANPRSPISPFVEEDEENDPSFSKVFNLEPGDDLLFQTTPLMPGALMEARCLQCHKFAQDQFNEVVLSTEVIASRKEAELARLRESIARDIQAKESIEALYNGLTTHGLEKTRALVQAQLTNPALSAEELDGFDAQLAFLESSESCNELKKRLDDQLKVIGELGDKSAQVESLESSLLQLRNATRPLEALSSSPSYVAQMADKASEMLGEAERGRELFINQACYACHKIEGLSRGAVGPDLTEIGLSYPWYVKLSIVWPQGKIESSAMPNMRLDHKEVEDLMAFLMAQTRDERALSQVDRDVRLSLWESEQKMAWEEPVLASEIRNLETGMTIFATQGCASCHKIVGYESDIGFTGNDKLADAAWFRGLFPDPISGAEVAERVEKHGQAIDERTGKVRSGSILERLQIEYPGVVESFYTPFAVARRANDDPLYQSRLDRIFMLYIQEYGFGRDIGPRLSWSGVMRDEEWLLGHFRNPTNYSAKSIMPVMPFDESKFYALDFMLQEVGKQNVAELRELWEVEGFHPELAFEMLCSTCHGTNRQGNGVVGEYLYPIPKNLRNATFLRNLTKEQAKQSIKEGVPGTPMAPWGEGVLTDSQIDQLVNWLYAELPGQTVVPDEVQKWEFSSQDVMEQLKEEGSELRSDQTAGPGTFLRSGFIPIFASTAQPEIFEERDGGLFIKRRFYTESNLQAGEEFFTRNCSHCHGPDGEGNGARAEQMIDAKPRMLTNLPWAQTRDDMRLIRSIRFGVPGTAMTPWGDKTSMLQQLQLVIFIRTLTEEKAGRMAIQRALFESYDRAMMVVERCRVGSSTSVAEAKKGQIEAMEERERWSESVQRGEGGAERATAAYREELESLGRLEVAKRRDEKLASLIDEIGSAKSLLAFAGEQLISAEPTQGMVTLFEEVIHESALFYLPKEECFEIEPPKGGSARDALIEELDGWIAKKRALVDRLKGRIWEGKLVEEEQDLLEELNRLVNLRTTLINQLRLLERSQQRQMEIYGQLQ